MEKNLYDDLLKKIKIFEKNIVKLPIFGEQSKHNLTHVTDSSEKFKLIINRKGHRNSDNLTILLNSVTYKSPMIRFDVNGSDHYNSTNDTLVPTPHLHIFTEEFDNGRIAVPLSDLQSEQLIEALIDSLEFFMDYSNINCENVTIETNLL